MKSKQRWKEMGSLGAVVLDEQTRQYVPVETADQAKAFFRGMAEFHTPLHPISPATPDHAWLVWLLQGHYNYLDLCPKGIDFFLVHRNSDIGYHGNERGFSVVSTGANNFAREFSYNQALKGVPKNPVEKTRIAFHNAVVMDEHEFMKWRALPGVTCPVTGAFINTAEMRVEYEVPLSRLMDDFCKHNCFAIEDVGVTDAGTSWLLLDPVRSQWQFYYRNIAKPVLVSIEGYLEIDRRRRLAARAQISS